MTAGPARFPSLFRPIRVGPRTLRNRIVVPSHQPRLAEGSLIGDRYVSYFQARARGGAAMLCTGDTAVVPALVPYAGDLRLANIDERIVPGYRRLADAVHAEGAVILAQLGDLALTGPLANQVAHGPSRLVSETTRDVVRPLRDSEIADLLMACERAAERCRRGGLDGVEAWIAYSSLGARFLSPLSNRRADRWGGSFEARLRFPLALVSALRRGVGDTGIIGVKLVVDGYTEGGIDPETGARIAGALVERERIDYLAATVGEGLTWQAQRRDRWPTGAPHGEFRAQCRAVKRAVGDIPVVYIGGVVDVAMAEDIVAKGDADLVGMARAHFADPDIARKALEGRPGDIRPCIHANLCINVTHNGGRPVQCISNPEVGQEAEWNAAFARPAKQQRVVIVGGGPAGLEGARMLARRGHRVTLLEREPHLGGQLRRYTTARYLREARRLLAWWEAQLRAVGVEILVGHGATADDVLALDPQLIVCATGSRPFRSEIPATGATTIVQVDPWEALERGVGGRVVIADSMGRADAFHLAERVVESAEEVWLATSCIHAGEGEGVGTLPQSLMRMGRLGVRLLERVRPVLLEGSTVHFASVLDGAGATVRGVDAIVRWAGGVAETALAEELAARGAPVRVIGDAVAPRRVANAVWDGAGLARDDVAYDRPTADVAL